jgi:hypothetical protein
MRQDSLQVIIGLPSIFLKYAMLMLFLFKALRENGGDQANQ